MDDLIDIGQELPPGWAPNPLTGIPEPVARRRALAAPTSAPVDDMPEPAEPLDPRAAAIAAAEAGLPPKRDSSSLGLSLSVELDDGE